MSGPQRFYFDRNVHCALSSGVRGHSIPQARLAVVVPGARGGAPPSAPLARAQPLLPLKRASSAASVTRPDTSHTPSRAFSPTWQSAAFLFRAHAACTARVRRGLRAFSVESGDHPGLARHLLLDIRLRVGGPRVGSAAEARARGPVYSVLCCEHITRAVLCV